MKGTEILEEDINREAIETLKEQAIIEEWEAMIEEQDQILFITLDLGIQIKIHSITIMNMTQMEVRLMDIKINIYIL
jgi:hypothetical protein